MDSILCLTQTPNGMHSQSGQNSNEDMDPQLLTSQTADRQVDPQSASPQYGDTRVFSRAESSGDGGPLVTPKSSSSSRLSQHPDQSEIPLRGGYSAISTTDDTASIRNGTQADRLGQWVGSPNHDTASVTDDHSSTSLPQDEWFPYTLSWQFLALLILFTVVLMMTIIVLYWYSVTHYGLAKDDESAMKFFGWRYAPSLFAVIYVQMTVMILDDVKRTEPFARMARPGGAPGSSTILQSSGAWWNALSDGISKKKNLGRRSWLLIACSLVNILGFLTISPLSPSILEPASVTITKPTSFTILSTNSTLPLSTERETYLRILGNILQNVSTSAWITDEYVVFPVWPSYLDSIPLEPSLSSDPETWQAETIVMNTVLDCRQMELKHTAFVNESRFDRYYNRTVQIPHPFISLSSNDGCIYNITFDIASDPLAFWADSPDEYWTSTNQSSECGDRELIMSMTPLVQYGKTYDPDIKNSGMTIRPDFNISAHICTAHYYMAKMEIVVHSTGTISSTSFDESKYLKERTAVPFDILNIDAIQKLALSSDWSMYTPKMGSSMSSDGLALPLAALYDFDAERMVKDKGMLAQAGRIRQRIFGEVIQHSLLHQGHSTEQSINGLVRTAERRILVVSGVATTIIIIFQVSLILLVFIWLLSRRCRRVLNLRGDPAKTTTVCSLIANQPNIRQTISGFDRKSEKQLYETIRENNYRSSHGVLHETYHRDEPSTEQLDTDSSTSITSIPVVLRLRTLCSLFVTLTLVLVSILVLYSFARRSNIHQTFFTYKASITVLGRKSPSVAPLSIIPTIIAVGIGLWWGSIDGTFRKLQPFLSIANGPTNAARGVALSYQSSYWIAATVKAASNRHWFLCFITIGTTLSQILTISMSALFQRSQANELSSVTVERSLEIRDVPFTYETNRMISADTDPVPYAVITNLFTELSTNWLYSATLELALNARQPRWSRDGWSFVPLDTEKLATGHISEQALTSLFQPMVNVTVETPAIRARLECTPYGGLENRTEWLTYTDTTNSSIWNQSTVPKEISGAYELGVDDDRIGGSKFLNTSFLTYPGIIQCCSNRTDNAVGRVALGYWSLDRNDKTYAAGPLDISIKWVYGDGISGLRKVEDGEYGGRLIFTDIPSMTAIRCRPILETSEATVTVRGDTGEVQSFTISSEAEEYDQAWSEAFVQRKQDPRIDRDDERYSKVNSTTSFGILFEKSLLTSADIGGINVNYVSPMPPYERIDDQPFNFRDPDQGLNLDFMTYSMYMKAGRDPTAFTNVSTLEHFAQDTFATFFQHFVSSNVSLTTGGWAYQPVNATFPTELGGVNKDWSDYRENTNYYIPHSHTNRTAVVQVSTPLEVLEMNAVAVWLSTGIILWLIVTTIIVGALQRRYLRNLSRNIDCLGDVLVLVAGSDRLLRLVNERGPSGLDREKGILTKLGWFEDERGQQRWGIEIVDVPGELDENSGASEQVTGTTADGPSSYELLPTQ